METAKGKAKSLQGMIGGTCFKDKIVYKRTGTNVNKRARSETQRSAARWGALGACDPAPFLTHTSTSLPGSRHLTGISQRPPVESNGNTWDPHRQARSSKQNGKGKGSIQRHVFSQRDAGGRGVPKLWFACNPQPWPRGGERAPPDASWREHREHPLGENDGAQGGICKWQSVDKPGWRRQRERRSHFKA